MYLFFDVETNGPAKCSYVPENDIKKDIKNLPRVVRLAFYRYSESGNVVSSYNEIVCPLDFDIPRDSSPVHGITKKRALREGICGEEIFRAFIDDAQKSECLVAHNFDYFYPVVCCELYRYGIENRTKMMEFYCTMKTESVKDYCALPDVCGDYRWPELFELYERLFGESSPNQKDADIRLKTCARCFFELKKREIL